MKHLPAELWKWDAVDLAPAIRHRAVSSREVVTACLRRMSEVNPAINAVVVDMSEQALAEADAADAAVARGDVLGALHGVPVTIKINVDQIGQATSNGVVAFKDVIAAEDSPVVSNLRKAGAVFLGRTNTPAFSSRWFTDNDLHGRTLNPWSAAHTPGGSSGGASAAVAAGIAPIAHGNDLAGSIRYPAYCAGVAGIRPSFGRVAAYLPTAFGKPERTMSTQMMSVQGPLARRVADLRLALGVMAQADARDPWWVPAPLQGEALAHPLRVAMAVDPSGCGVHPDVAQAMRDAARYLQEAGYIVEEVELPAFNAIADAWQLLARAEAPLSLLPNVQAHGDSGIKKAVHWHLGDHPVPTAQEYMNTLAQRTGWIRQWSMFMQRYPLVLCPTSLQPPFPQGMDTESKASLESILAAQAPSFVVPMLGLPSTAVPTGIGASGLPTGVQIIGQRFREDMTLDAAQVIEARAPMQTPINPR
ncbi:amidase family protein [Variovorax dokdonensis]|uniref:Amidase family protein n=1 Tax=Variovorax dokdonensis TaxID=344883 RepID=A0ABT7NEY3_9BURK|nr:amidase family protein [Variovorax dokdonensis]MDM0046497.1 amidase family protein [Variovorax dokdonensis]